MKPESTNNRARADEISRLLKQVRMGPADIESRSQVDRARLEPGSIIAGYRILSCLGAGAHGVVYLVTDGRFQTALKILHEDIAQSPRNSEFRARFQREAKIGLQLSHPNLVKCFEAGVWRDRYYLSSEFIRGGSLNDLLARGPLNEFQSLTLIQGVLKALKKLDEEELIHRDVKASNVLVTLDKVAKLADLGLARSSRLDFTRLTKTGRSPGTPAFMAPEQIQGETMLDIRCDLYSVGVLLYYCLTATLPFQRDSLQELLKAHMEAAIPDIRCHAPNTSGGLIEILESLLQKERERRPKRPAIVIEQIESLLPTTQKNENHN
ncbi:MAG: serine/threonine-protein kinase [Planctomycetota bacterium]|nr:serine/threonine-protein kinase [Planctomycetota bacterium]